MIHLQKPLKRAHCRTFSVIYVVIHPKNVGNVPAVPVLYGESIAECILVKFIGAD